jgi:CheY-like chemotaxis protein
MNKRILLADDSLTIQKVVELTFMDEDFDVDAVGSGGEAIARLEEALPSILIADVHMPGPSGYDVCRRAKEISSDLPVLLLVGTFEELDEDEIVACGADGNLKKPFDSQELLQRVREMTTGPAPTVTAEVEVAGLEPTAHDEGGMSDDEPSEEDAQHTAVDDEAAPSSDPEGDDLPVSPVGFSFGSGVLEADPEIEPVELVEEPVQEPEALADDAEAFRVEESVEALIEEDAGVFDAAFEGEVISVETEPPEPEAFDEPSVAVEESASEVSTEPVADSPVIGNGISDADVDRIARRVVELMADDAVREVAWDVIPDLAEIVIKDRIQQLEAEAE